MPTISLFYGIIISMLYMDNKQHKAPHIHASYQGQSAALSIPDGEVLAGSIPAGKLKLVRAWIEIHQEDLLANWELAVNGRPVVAIEPLK
jgi:hypothetical protein